MPRREMTPEERAALSDKMKAAHAKKREEAEAMKELEAQQMALEQPEAEVMPPIPEDDGAGIPLPVFDEPEQAAPVSLDPFDVFLGSLTQETRDLLDIEELREQFAEAQARARDERRAQLKKAAADKAKAHARGLAGLVPKEQLEVLAWQEKMSRKVRWTPVMPFVADTGGIADEGLLIDGRRYYHGQEVETTYGEWLSAREMIWRLRQHELDFEGKGRLHHLRRMVSERGFDFNGVRQ